MLQVTTLLEKDFWSISGVIVTHFKPLLYHKLKWVTMYPFVLSHPIVNSYFRYQSSTRVGVRDKNSVRTDLINRNVQWRRQRSKGARSFRAQNILEPRHLDALFFLKLTTFLVVALKTQRSPTPLRFTVKIKQIKRSAVRYGKSVIFCSHYYRSKAKQ